MIPLPAFFTSWEFANQAKLFATIWNWLVLALGIVLIVMDLSTPSKEENTKKPDIFLRVGPRTGFGILLFVFSLFAFFIGPVWMWGGIIALTGGLGIILFLLLAVNSVFGRKGKAF